MIDGISNRPLYFLPKGHYWFNFCVQVLAKKVKWATIHRRSWVSASPLGFQHLSTSFNILLQVIIGKTMVTILRENQHFYDGVTMVEIVIFVVKITKGSVSYLSSPCFSTSLGGIGGPARAIHGILAVMYWISIIRGGGVMGSIPTGDAVTGPHIRGTLSMREMSL